MKPRKEYFEDAPKACPQCDSQGIEVQMYSDTLDFRNLVLDVTDLMRYRCSTCQFTWHTPSQRIHNNDVLRIEYSERRDHIRQRDGMLSGPQIKAIREALGLNQREAANLFGGGANAFNKYETGEVLQSYAMDRLIRMAGHFGVHAVVFLNKLDTPDANAVVPLTVGHMSAASVSSSNPNFRVFEVDKELMVETFQRLRIFGTHAQLGQEGPKLTDWNESISNQRQEVHLISSAPKQSPNLMDQPAYAKTTTTYH